jgi:hypothetical protein
MTAPLFPGTPKGQRRCRIGIDTGCGFRQARVGHVERKRSGWRAMSGYRVAYMIGNLLTESIIRTLGELCEVTT